MPKPKGEPKAQDQSQPQAEPQNQAQPDATPDAGPGGLPRDMDMSPDDIIMDALGNLGFPVEGGEDQTTGEPEPQQGDAGTQQGDDQGKKDTEAHFQARYQAVMETLKQLNPTVYDRVREQVRSQFKGTAPDTKASPEPNTAPDDTMLRDDVTIADLTPRQLQALIQTATRATVQNEFQSLNVQAESVQATKLLENMAEQLGLAEEDAQQAIEEAGLLGIDVNQPGGPTRWARAVASQMMLRALLKQSQDAGANAKREAERKGREAALTQRPPGAGGAPGSNEPTSPQLRMLEAMRRAGSARGHTLLESQRGKT